MGTDNNDFYEKIREINQQNALSENSMNQAAPNPLEVPAFPKKNSGRLAEYAPGLILIVWTILPVLLISWDMYLILQLCIYPLLSPFIWFNLGRWSPDNIDKTIPLGFVGHLLLAGGILWIFKTGFGDGYFFALDAIAALLIIVVLILSAVGNIIVILFGADHEKRVNSKRIE